MSIRWRGGNWTAGNWDANYWLGPNTPPPPGSISGTTTITFTTTGTLSAIADGFVSGSTTFGITGTGTLSAIGVVIPDNLAGGGGSGKGWKKRKEETDALKAAIRRAMYGAEEAVEDAVEAVQIPAPSTPRVQPPTLELPDAADYTTELAHLDAITRMLDRISREIPAINQRRAEQAAREKVERARPKIDKVRKLLAMLDLVDA